MCIVKILYPAKFKKEGSRGRPLEPGAATAKIRRLLHQPHRLDRLRLRGVHVAGLARGLGIADQLRRVAARSLGTGGRPRSLHVLTATRSLDVLTHTRGLDVLAAARRLDVLTAARSLDVLTRTRRLHVATRSLHVLTPTR